MVPGQGESQIILPEAPDCRQLETVSGAVMPAGVHKMWPTQQAVLEHLGSSGASLHRSVFVQPLLLGYITMNTKIALAAAIAALAITGCAKKEATEAKEAATEAAAAAEVAAQEAAVAAEAAADAVVEAGAAVAEGAVDAAGAAVDATQEAAAEAVDATQEAVGDAAVAAGEAIEETGEQLQEAAKQ